MRTRSTILTLAGFVALAGMWINIGNAQSDEPPAQRRVVQPVDVDPGAPTPRNVCYGFSTIDLGQYSQFGDYCGGDFFEVRFTTGTPPCYADVAHPAVEMIIRDDCAWNDFWEQHAGGPPPTVDFDRDVVVAVISGPKPNGGCLGIEITHIQPTDCGVKIFIRERIPCDEFCNRSITNPYHIIRVCKQLLPYEKPTCFERRNQPPTCNLYLECAVLLPE